MSANMSPIAWHGNHSHNRKSGFHGKGFRRSHTEAATPKKVSAAAAAALTKHDEANPVGRKRGNLRQPLLFGRQKTKQQNFPKQSTKKKYFEKPKKGTTTIGNNLSAIRLNDFRVSSALSDLQNKVVERFVTRKLNTRFYAAASKDSTARSVVSGVVGLNEPQITRNSGQTCGAKSSEGMEVSLHDFEEIISTEGVDSENVGMGARSTETVAIKNTQKQNKSLSSDVFAKPAEFENPDAGVKSGIGLSSTGGESNDNPSILSLTSFLPNDPMIQQIAASGDQIIRQLANEAQRLSENMGEGGCSVSMPSEVVSTGNQKKELIRKDSDDTAVTPTDNSLECQDQMLLEQKKNPLWKVEDSIIAPPSMTGRSELLPFMPEEVCPMTISPPSMNAEKPQAQKTVRKFDVLRQLRNQPLLPGIPEASEDTDEQPPIHPPNIDPTDKRWAESPFIHSLMDSVEDDPLMELSDAESAFSRALGSLDGWRR